MHPQNIFRDQFILLSSDKLRVLFLIERCVGLHRMPALGTVEEFSDIFGVFLLNVIDARVDDA